MLSSDSKCGSQQFWSSPPGQPSLAGKSGRAGGKQVRVGQSPPPTLGSPEPKVGPCPKHAKKKKKKKVNSIVERCKRLPFEARRGRPVARLSGGGDRWQPASCVSSSPSPVCSWSGGQQRQFCTRSGGQKRSYSLTDFSA